MPQEVNIAHADMNAVNNRQPLVLRVEWLLLILRYVSYVVLAILSVATQDNTLQRVFMIAGTVALAHNIFAHAIFYTHRTAFFVSPWNFLLYLLLICLLVGTSGGAASPFAPLFLFLIIGYHVYSPRTFDSVWITLLVCASYSFTVIANWAVSGFHLLNLPLYINLFLIAFCGWIMGMLAHVMRRLERDAHRKATALESSEATLRAILDHTAHPILVYDENELITDVNESACAFLALPRQKLVGLRFRAFIFDDGLLGESLDNLKHTGSLHQEMLVLPTGGRERNVYMHVHSFLGEGKRLFVALFHDITNQKELQEANSLAQMNLEKANQELQRVMDLRASFYINIANRLRSPLAAILGFTEMLLEEQLGDINEEQRNALHSSRRSLMRIFEQLDEAFVLEKDLSKSKNATETASVHDSGAGI